MFSPSVSLNLAWSFSFLIYTDLDQNKSSQYKNQISAFDEEKMILKKNIFLSKSIIWTIINFKCSLCREKKSLKVQLKLENVERVMRQGEYRKSLTLRKIESSDRYVRYFFRSVVLWNFYQIY